MILNILNKSAQLSWTTLIVLLGIDLTVYSRSCVVTLQEKKTSLRFNVV